MYCFFFLSLLCCNGFFFSPHPSIHLAIKLQLLPWIFQSGNLSFSVLFSAKVDFAGINIYASLLTPSGVLMFPVNTLSLFYLWCKRTLFIHRADTGWGKPTASADVGLLHNIIFMSAGCKSHFETIFKKCITVIINITHTQARNELYIMYIYS